MVAWGRDDVRVRMPDGKVLLSVPEAAELWRKLGNPPMSPSIYRRRCQSGELTALGVEISEGPRFLTDLDSLLAYFDRGINEARKRVDAALEQRRRELAEGK